MFSNANPVVLVIGPEYEPIRKLNFFLSGGHIKHPERIDHEFKQNLGWGFNANEVHCKSDIPQEFILKEDIYPQSERKAKYKKLLDLLL